MFQSNIGDYYKIQTVSIIYILFIDLLHSLHFVHYSFQWLHQKLLTLNNTAGEYNIT